MDYNKPSNNNNSCSSQSSYNPRVRQLSKQEKVLQMRKKEIEEKLSFSREKQNSNTPSRPSPILGSENLLNLKEELHQQNSEHSFPDSLKKYAMNFNSNPFKTDSATSGSMSPKMKLEDTDTTCLSPESTHPRLGIGLHNKNISPLLSTCINEIKNEDASKSDWFQDAIRRAKEKAEELNPSSVGVSLSAGSLPTTQSLNDSKKRKSRWGEKSQVAPATPVVLPSNSISNNQQTSFNMPGNIMGMVGQGQHMEAIQGIMISQLTRSNPAIINYALKVFGSVDIADVQWKQCEEQMKMNIVFQVLKAKKIEAEKLQQQGKVKYEYDSDEDIDGGTWEHKRRKKEMEQTASKAEVLTRESDGKHHIGDFLPPEELAGFIEKYSAMKEGRDPDLSDYRENRLTEDNVGYKMLKSMGWTEGTGLGADGKGITAPVNQKAQNERQGVGAGAVNNISERDDEFDAYRKRMMLAYRFRPNPLNNPRRSYY